MALEALLPNRRERTCASCGSDIPASRLACPACHALVHADALRRLAGEAEGASRKGDRASAVRAWREALELLPPDSVQSKQVGERIAMLTRDGEPSAPASATTDKTGAPGKRRGAISAALASVAVVLSKFKLAIFFMLTKLKWLALGLSKGTTVLTMLLSIGVYWAAFGWPFAVGFVVCIYIHEMGHVAALEQLGIKATAPMFVPGLGAFVRLKQYPASPSEDARVGLAGPLWGMAAAVACFAVWRVSGGAIWGALAEWGARINLFNLMPLGSLDGGRGFRALSRAGRWSMVALIGGAWIVSQEGMLLLVLLVAGARALAAAPETSDRRALVTFAVLIVGLSALAALPLALGLRP
jgi:Zn-dependent protease